MNPQFENGYTKIANELYEQILKQPLSGYEFRVLQAIIRKTYGYNKKEDNIALSQLEKMTGIKKTHISLVLKKLAQYNIVTKIGNGNGKLGLMLKLNKDYTTWIVTKIGKGGKPLPKSVKTVTENGNKPLPKSAPQKKKETITKEIYTSKNSLTPCTDKEILSIALDLNVHPSDVKKTHDSILDDIAAKEFKHKTIYFTLRKWTRMNISNGYIKTLSKISTVPQVVDIPKITPDQDKAARSKIEEIRKKMREGGLSSLKHG